MNPFRNNDIRNIVRSFEVESLFLRKVWFVKLCCFDERRFFKRRIVIVNVFERCIGVFSGFGKYISVSNISEICREVFF